MALFDIFKSTPAPTPAPAVPATPVTPGNIPSPTADLNNQTPVSPAPESMTPKIPLDEFAKLWEASPVTTDPSASGEPSQELTADLVNKALSGTNFASSIPQEQFAAISEGGDAAIEAMKQIANSIAQTAISQSLLISNKLNTRELERALKKQEDSLPALLRGQAASDHLKLTNPLFSNPAVKPVIEATKQQLLQKFPDATPQEITQMTQDYIIAMGATFAPKESVNANGGTEVDWEAFFKS